MLAIFFTSNSGKIGCSLQELFHFSRELFRIVEILRDAPNAYIRRSPVGDQMSNSDDTVYTFFYAAVGKLIKSIGHILIKSSDQCKYVFHFRTPRPIQILAHEIDDIQIRSFFRVFQQHIPAGSLQVP